MRSRAQEWTEETRQANLPFVPLALDRQSILGVPEMRGRSHQFQKTGVMSCLTKHFLLTTERVTHHVTFAAVSASDTCRTWSTFVSRRPRVPRKTRNALLAFFSNWSWRSNLAQRSCATLFRKESNFWKINWNRIFGWREEVLEKCPYLWTQRPLFSSPAPGPLHALFTLLAHFPFHSVRSNVSLYLKKAQSILHGIMFCPQK